MNTREQDLEEIREWIKANHPELDAVSIEQSAQSVIRRFADFSRLRNFNDWKAQAAPAAAESLDETHVGRFETRYMVSHNHNEKQYKGKARPIKRLMHRWDVSADEAERLLVTVFVRVDED